MHYFQPSKFVLYHIIKNKQTNRLVIGIKLSLSLPLSLDRSLILPLGGTLCCLQPIGYRHWKLQLFPINTEEPVSADHEVTMITSLSFVHIAVTTDGMVE